jgi:plastocyanin
MDTPESTKPAAGPSPDEMRRRRWPFAVAILALAVAMFSLATLRGGQAPSSSTAAQSGQVDLTALAAQSPLAVPIYQGLAQQQAAGGAAAPAAAPTTTSVDAMGYKFTPAAVTIAVGDTVTWTNHDQAPHNIVVTDGPEKFTSPTLQTGQSFSYTFTKAGTYSYYCAIHPDMKATVTVQGSTSPSPTSSPSAPPTSNPTTPPSSSSSSMSMPSSPAGGGSCVSKAALQPFIDHIKFAHLETSPAQQAQDILNLDQYIKTHTVLLENMLAPAFNGSANQVVTDTLAPMVQHIKSAHLETSLGQQVTDLLNLDQYIKTHTVLLENVLTPLLNQATC